MKNRVDKSLPIISLIVFLFLFSCNSSFTSVEGSSIDQADTISNLRFHKVLEINPKLNVYYNRGLSIDKSEYDNAISDFNEAIEIIRIDVYISRGGVYINKSARSGVLISIGS
jgi:hypothetical protein